MKKVILLQKIKYAKCIKSIFIKLICFQVLIISIKYWSEVFNNGNDKHIKSLSICFNLFSNWKYVIFIVSFLRINVSQKYFRKVKQNQDIISVKKLSERRRMLNVHIESFKYLWYTMRYLCVIFELWLIWMYQSVA